MRRRFALLISALLGAAVPAAAGPAGEMELNISGSKIRGPLPEGFCHPTGFDVRVSEVLAATDKDNATHLTLMPCGRRGEAGEAPPSEYVLFKTPHAALSVAMDRAELLAGIGAAFENPEFTAALESGAFNERAGKGFEDVLGKKVSLSGDIAPRGKDDVCAYFGGTMAVASGATSYQISLGACITAVGKRMVTVNAYGPGNGAAGVAKLIARSRAIAVSLAPAS